MRRQGENQGFSLIEVAIAIAIVAILAGAAIPLALKALDQARESKTRDNLKAAFEAMFGARDHRSANMRNDFGFNPGALADLRVMTTRTPATLPNWGPNLTSFSWGWNGPYWNGSVQPLGGTNGLPADGWGRPVSLRFLGGGWQVFSLGANGQNNTGASLTALGDDLVYPPTPALVAGYTSGVTVNIQIFNTSNVAIPIPVGSTIRVWTSRSAATPYDSGNQPLGASPVNIPGATFPGIANPLPSGPLQITVTLGNPPPPPVGAVTLPPNPQTQVLDLAPGEFKQVDFKFRSTAS